MLARHHAKPGLPLERPAMLERRSNELLRARFERADRLLRASPNEPPQEALFHGLKRLQVIYPELPDEVLAGVIQAVLQARRSRPARTGSVPGVSRLPRRAAGEA